MPKATPDEELRLPFFGHLEELRKRIIYSLLLIAVGFVICFSYSETILKVLMMPMNAKLHFQASFPFFTFVPNAVERKLHFTKLIESFWVHMKIGLIAGIILMFPLLAYQAWKFVAPGLVPKERRYAGYFVFFSTGFFAMGILFCFLVLLPVAVTFLLGYKTESLIPIITINEYIDFILKFLLASGAVFELPLIIVLLSRVGIVSPDWLAKRRKYAFLVSFILGAMLTPTPDAFNMTLMSLPIYLLYEVGILVARLFGKKKEPDSAEIAET